MGDLGQDTAVWELGDGVWGADVSQEWEIWGPMGGYMAAIALRAAGAAGPAAAGRRPAAFSCHYLGVAAFAAVQIRVDERKGGRSAASQRVEITQDGRAILDAMVWSVAVDEGLEHDETQAPDIAGPDELPSMAELVPPDAKRPFPFWENFDSKPLMFEPEWPPPGPRPAVWQEWMRFLPTSRFDDPWVDAGRTVILVDLPSWPAGHRPHAWSSPQWVAPTLDLHVSFHRSTSDHEWLLCDGTAPLSTEGLLPWSAKVWTPTGQLVASGGGQCLYRRIPPRP